MRRYSVLLIPDFDDGGYTVLVPALPGCVAEGETAPEALEHARDAIRLYLEDLEATGEPIPEEREAVTLEAVEV